MDTFLKYFYDACSEHLEIFSHELLRLDCYLESKITTKYFAAVTVKLNYCQFNVKVIGTWLYHLKGIIV